MSSGKEIQSLLFDKQKAIAKNNWKDLAAICNYLGKLYSERGELENALNEHKEELKICKSKLKDDNGIAIAHRNIGEVYAEMEEYKKSLESLKIYLDKAEEMKDFVEIQRAWATIGRTYYMKGDLKRALTAFETALKLAVKARASVKEVEYHEMRCRSYLNIALVYDQKDDVNEGCRYYSMAIQIATKHNLKETLHRCQNSLGLFYQKLEHYDRALKFINDSLATVKSMKNKVFQCEYLITKGHVLLLKENTSEARHVFKKACYCKTPVLEDLQKAHFKFKRTSAIRELLAKITSSRDSIEANDPETAIMKAIDDLLKIYDKLGDLFADLEAYPVAVKYYQKELDLALDHKCSSSILAPIYFSLAQTHLDQKNYDQALDYFNKELELRSGNLIEATRTSLKIIETKIDMKCRKAEIIDKYEEALDRFKEDDSCRFKILKDFSLYLQQEKEFAKARKVDDQLANLSIDLSDDPTQVETTIDDGEGNVNPETNDFEDLSSLSSSSCDEEDPSSITNGVGDRAKRKLVKKFKTNEVGETPLHRACIEGNMKEVRRLLSKGHPVNQRDHCGWLPIHEACNFGYAEIARLLIDAGADINDPGGNGCGGTTPLHDSCSNCVPDVIRLLIEKGADVTKLDSDGNTAIDCLRGFRRRVRELSKEEEDIYNDLVKKLECEMRKRGFDLEAEKRRPVIRVTPASSSATVTVPNDHDERRGDGIFESRSAARRRRMVHSPNSSPPRKKITGTRDGNDLDRNYEDPEVARLEYQSVISNLRRQRSKFSPDNGEEELEQDDDDYDGLHLQSTKPSSSSHPALLNEDEKIDDWLVDDMGASKTHRSQIILDLYHSKNLPKNERRINQFKQQPKKERNIVERGKMRKAGSSSLPNRNVTFLKGGKNDLVQVSDDDDTFGGNGGESDGHDDGRREVECVSSSSSAVPFEGERRELESGVGRKVNSEPQEFSSSSSSSLSNDHHQKTKALIKVCLDSKSFLMSLPDKDGTTMVSWLIQETVCRYYNIEKKKPVIYLTTKDGSLLSSEDLILDVVTDGEVRAHIKSFDSLSLEAGYQEMCRMNQVKPIAEMDQVLKISETNGNLNLSNMNIPQLHLKILADTVESSDKITCLDFSFTRFTHSSARLTFKSGRTIIPAILLDLASKLPRLKDLRLRGLGITGNDLDRFISSNNPALTLQISLLDLSYNPLGSNSSLESLLSFIMLVPALHTLCLIACNLDGKGFFQDARMVRRASTGQVTSEEREEGQQSDVSPGSKIHQVMVDDSMYNNGEEEGNVIQQLYQNQCLKTHKWKKIHRI